jgi:hypothetical protein
MRHAAAIAFLIALHAAAPAAGPPPKVAPADRELAAIVKDWEDAWDKSNRAYDEAKTEAEREKARAMRDFKPFANRAFRLVEAHPGSPVAMRALVFVVKNTRTGPVAERAIKLLKPRVARADLGYLRKHLSAWFPYGMEVLAPAVFAKVKARPKDPAAPGAAVWVCLAAGHGQSKGSRDLFREATE